MHSPGARTAFWVGVREAVIVVPSYLPFALVCGVASVNAGLTTGAALALPALVFAGVFFPGSAHAVHPEFGIALGRHFVGLRDQPAHGGLQRSPERQGAFIQHRPAHADRRFFGGQQFCLHAKARRREPDRPAHHCLLCGADSGVLANLAGVLRHWHLRRQHRADKLATWSSPCRCRSSPLRPRPSAACPPPPLPWWAVPPACCCSRCH